MAGTITRRRFIGISAAACGLTLLPFEYRGRAEASVVSWSGVALGAAASLQVHHPDRGEAQRLINRAVAELRRLEAIFSLYRDDSALTLLNRRGVLEAPAPELVRLLAEARRYAALTGGVFDPTVQPLWGLYAAHFARPDAYAGGPSPAERETALALVGFDRVHAGRDRIAFATRGMALTLNGIAQGFITDRVVELLLEGGIAQCLVDMGEARALGSKPDGAAWTLGIADPDRPGGLTAILPLADQAAATSGGYGFRFDREGRFSHLLDPRTGLSANRYKSVTVLLPTATAADALSTAFTLMPPAEISVVLRAVGQGKALLITADGERQELMA